MPISPRNYHHLRPIDALNAQLFASPLFRARLPQIESFEVAEVALRRGQLAQAPPETISLAASHFAKRAHRRGSATAAAVGQTNGRGGGGGRSGGADLLPTAQALAMAERIGSLSARRKFGRVPCKAVESDRQDTKPTQPGSTDKGLQRGQKGDKDDADVCTAPAAAPRGKRAQRRGAQQPIKEKDVRRQKKRGRPQETSSHRGGVNVRRCAKASGNDGKNEAGDSMEVSTDGEGKEEEEEEEMEWKG